ncbi:MAG TPA: 16S rRNA (guanine(966)-N(2))-methyltransferase RsmD [Polyangia bacterium]|nr:16S rRNA (guanine(966)-N(2))-methyltransferase RsmD [Polyangia bacterium]
MRIIAGSVGGRRLKAPRGLHTRPTADRVREAVFNILVARGEPPERVLDLYAGSGALGLEALSRGARQAVFVEQHGETLDLIRANARELGFATSCQFVRSRSLDWLAKGGGKFGWIFLDPPYAAKELDRALALIAERALVAEGGVVIAEHDWRAEPLINEASGLELLDRRRYGQTAVSFYTANEAK